MHTTKFAVAAAIVLDVAGADGHTTRVNVPRLNDGVLVVGVSGDNLELLGPPVNGGGVTEAIPFGRN